MRSSRLASYHVGTVLHMCTLQRGTQPTRVIFTNMIPLPEHCIAARAALGQHWSLSSTPPLPQYQCTGTGHDDRRLAAMYLLPMQSACNCTLATTCGLDLRLHLKNYGQAYIDQYTSAHTPAPECASYVQSIHMACLCHIYNSQQVLTLLTSSYIQKENTMRQY